MADTILQGEKITKVFFQGKTETKVLDGIDIEIYENDFTGIMGPSGAGKSTLLYRVSLALIHIAEPTRPRLMS